MVTLLRVLILKQYQLLEDFESGSSFNFCELVTPLTFIDVTTHIGMKKIGGI
jgi:hypothetical protein